MGGRYCGRVGRIGLIGPIGRIGQVGRVRCDRTDPLRLSKDKGICSMLGTRLRIPPQSAL